MSPLNLDRLIVAFNNDSMDEWASHMEICENIRIKDYLKVFISYQVVNQKVYKSINLPFLAKDVVQVLSAQRIIKNTQQVTELVSEKVFGSKQEVRIFIQKA
jgi:hypothetical protein